MNRKHEASGAFFIIPKALIYCDEYSPISARAKLLYGLLLDRMKLSEKNGLRDSEGKCYVHFSIKETVETFGCGTAKAVEYFRELEHSGLIKRVKQGQGKKIRIYITDTKLLPDGKNMTFRTENSEASEKEIQDFSDEKGNNTEKNNTDFSNTLLRCSAEEEIKENINYSYLTEIENRDEIDSVVSIIDDTVNTCCRTVHIGAEVYPREKVRERLMSLNEEHIIYVLESLRTNRNQIRDIRAYILKLLFYAPAAMNLYYTAKVSSDMNRDSG